MWGYHWAVQIARELHLSHFTVAPYSYLLRQNTNYTVFWLSFMWFLNFFFSHSFPSHSLAIRLVLSQQHHKLHSWHNCMSLTIPTTQLPPHIHLAAPVGFHDQVTREHVTFFATAMFYKPCLAGENIPADAWRQPDGPCCHPGFCVGSLPLASLDFKFFCPPRLAGSASVTFLYSLCAKAWKTALDNLPTTIFSFTVY